MTDQDSQAAPKAARYPSTKSTAAPADKKPPFKGREDVTLLVTDGLQSHNLMMQQLGDRQDQRMIVRQRQDEERLQLERERAVREMERVSREREQEKERLERDRQRDERERIGHEQEVRFPEQSHQLALTERFFTLLDRGLEPDAIGQVVFGTGWKDHRQAMMAMVRGARGEQEREAE